MVFGEMTVLNYAYYVRRTGCVVFVLPGLSVIIVKTRDFLREFP